LRFPERFFFGEDIGELAAERASFRASSKLSARQRDMALGSASVAMAFSQQIGRLFALPEPDLPDVTRRKDPEWAAERLRFKWHLDHAPIPNMMELLEGRGVRVFSLPTDAAEADTFSTWHQERPFVFLDARKPSDQQRFDLACELGHLLLHRDAPCSGPKAQQAATAFACAFLMPPASLRGERITDIASLARKWGVPLPAVVRRQHQLGILSEWRCRRLRGCIDGRAGKGAPADQPEISLLLRRVFVSLRSRGVTKQKLASTLFIYPRDLDELAFGLALSCLDGKAGSGAALLPPRLTFVRPASG
jgi:Zn-dependent peptidase ImmA (M78 family)